MGNSIIKSGVLSSGLLGLTLACQGVSAAEMDHSKHQMEGMDHSGMGDSAAMHVHHGHREGGFMFEYRYMNMNMSGLQNGEEGITTREISGANPGMPPTNNVNTAYMMSPTDMDMQMHMFMAMYGITEKLTFMGMLHYLYTDMDMVMHMVMPNGSPMIMPNGMPMDMFGSMRTSGLGDTRLDLMYTVNKSVTASLGVSVPTGDIDQKVTMTMTAMNGASFTNANFQAPYPMQLGSGTLDIIPSVTYQSMGMGAFSYGGQFTYTSRGSDNDNNYVLGDKLDVSGWLKYKDKATVLSARLNYIDWDSIEGADPSIPAMMAPTSDPAATGGTRLDLHFGATGYIDKHHSIGVEYGHPILQDLNAPDRNGNPTGQMKTQSLISISYMYMM